MSHDPWGGGSDDDPKLRDKERARQRFTEQQRRATVEKLLRQVPQAGPAIASKSSRGKQRRNPQLDKFAPMIPALAALAGILAVMNHFLK